MKYWIYGVIAAAILPFSVAISPARADDFFGSISYSPSTRMYGYSYDYDSENDAVARSQSECNNYSDWSGDCQPLIMFQNACGSLATASDGSYGSGWGADVDTAEYYALDTCGQHSDDCEVTQSVCTTNSL